jgi:hypothetical protein
MSEMQCVSSSRKTYPCQKAYGVDNIAAELLQALDEETKHTLCCVINNTTGKIPDDFKKIIVVMLPKKSKSTKCEEYRTLSILTHISKILTKVILGRIEKEIDKNIAEDQIRLRKNRST